MLRKTWCSTQRLVVLAATLGVAGPALASTTATITVGGSEQQINGAWDQSTITVSFNGYRESVTYGQFSSAQSVAAALAGMFTRDYASVGLSAKANCPPNGAQISFTLQGSSTFGTLDIQGSTTSFSFSETGFESMSSVVADAGTVTLTVNGVTAAQTNYGQGATPSSVAEGLAAGVTSSSPVTISAVGDELDLQAKTGGSSTNYSYTLQTTSYDSANFSQPSFMNPAASGSLEGGADQNSTGATIYSYSIPYPATSTQGYNPNGTILGYTDSVMGSWSFTYDDLNRLATAVVTPSVDNDAYYCWSYDNFGNRLQQMGSNESITGGGSSTCTQQSGSNVNLTWANYSPANNNQITTSAQAPSGVSYDAAGDITNDGHVSYLYNADGQICAVETTYESMTIMYGYIYDGDGNRVAKGTIASWSCDPSANGFVATANYVLDQSGQQLNRFVPDTNGNIVLDYTNVWTAGALMATYDGDNLHFYLNDWLGTRRVQTNYSGVVEQDCMSLPYGDSETCGPTPAENLYTGKARDAETAGGVSPFGVNQGNDYFGARYYASSMGRFLSPDWSEEPDPTPYADLDNPQTLNLYAYVQNNPLTLHDATGHYSCDSDYDTTDPNTGAVTVHGGQCHYDLSDFGYMASAVGHHFIPKQVWQDIDQASNAWKVLNRTTTGALKGKGKILNRWNRLHRSVNKQTEEVVEKLEKDLGKSIEDFNKGDFQELQARLEAAGGDIGTFNAKMAELEPEARTLGDAIGEALEEVFPAAVNAAGQTAPLAGDAAEGAADIP